MKGSDFRQIKYFTAKEVRATGARLKDVNYNTIWTLNQFRKLIGMPVKITSLTTGKHASQSFHYTGRAVDFKVCPGRGKRRPSHNTVVQKMLEAGFLGVGVYKNFYHGDDRIRPALWKRVNGIYLPLVENEL